MRYKNTIRADTNEKLIVREHFKESLKREKGERKKLGRETRNKKNYSK